MADVYYQSDRTDCTIMPFISSRAEFHIGYKGVYNDDLYFKLETCYYSNEYPAEQCPGKYETEAISSDPGFVIGIPPGQIAYTRVSAYSDSLGISGSPEYKNFGCN